MKRISWQELRDVCKLVGCVEALGEDIVRSNMRTVGLVTTTSTVDNKAILECIA